MLGLALLLLHGCSSLLPEPPPAPREAEVAPHRADARRRVEPAPAPLDGEYACETGRTRHCYLRIPGGSFTMGAQATAPTGAGYDPHARPDEGPVRTVSLPDFRIMRFEASVGLFHACVLDGWCDPEDTVDEAGRTGVDAGQPGGLLPDRAVSGISWLGAARLCAWMGGRLPTEAEWERAARGTSGRRFPWGDEPHCGRTRPQLDPAEGCAFDNVSKYAELFTLGNDIPEGMGGNVWEWVADRYAADAYASAPRRDPRGPAEGDARVQRGGGWLSQEVWELRSAARGALRPDQKLPDVGVRCARDEAR